MNIVRNDNEFLWNKITAKGSYEWWYFDCISDSTDYSLVVILYSGFPFAPAYHKDINKGKDTCSFDFPGVTLCLYKGNRKVINIHRTMKDIKYTGKGVSIKTPGNILLERKNDGSQHIVIETSSLYREKSFVCELNFFPIQNLNNQILPELSGNRDHYWKPANPKGFITAEIDIYKKNKRIENIFIKGSGYNDQNWGFVPIYHKISEWNWGRFHSDELNGIFFDIEYQNGYDERFSKLILYDNNGKLVYSGKASFFYNKKRNYFNLNYGKEIKIESDNISILVKCNDKVDNGPFYIRFLSDFEINYNGKNIITNGFTEYVSPGRLKNRFLYPFISLKLK